MVAEINVILSKNTYKLVENKSTKRFSSAGLSIWRDKMVRFKKYEKIAKMNIIFSFLTLREKLRKSKKSWN